MNGDELVNEVLETLQDISFNYDDALTELNKGLVRTAQLVDLPGLSDGQDVVNTDATTQVAVPTDYMKKLYAAFTDNQELTIYANKRLFQTAHGEIKVVSGPTQACMVHNGFLVYQRVPSAPEEIRLSYYRKPAPLLYKKDSYLDGFEHGQDVSDLLDQAVLNHALMKLFSKIEQGQAQKPDTAYHKGLFDDGIDELRLRTAKQRPNPEPTICEQNW